MDTFDGKLAKKRKLSVLNWLYITAMSTAMGKLFYFIYFSKYKKEGFIK
jgi:hypothetical protein